MLEKEFKYYLDNQEDLIAAYRNKFVVIKGEQVIGVYDSNSDALSETAKEHELGTFLIQLCIPGQDLQTFHSRVIFNR